MLKIYINQHALVSCPIFVDKCKVAGLTFEIRGDFFRQKYPRTGMCEGMGLQFICADMASLGNFMMAFR